MKRNLIEDNDLLERLRRCGFKFFDSPTYEDAINWFIDRKNILITIYPLFGEKIGYDTFKIYAWSYDVSPIIDGGGVYLCSDDLVDNFISSYKYTLKPGEQKDPDYPREFPTRIEAIKNAVEHALIFYIGLQTNGKALWDGYRKKNMIQQPKEWPQYVALSDEGCYHSFYILIKSVGVYKRWDKDEFDFGDEIKVLYDGKEYLIANTDFNHQYGKKVWPVSELELVANLFRRNNKSINGVSFDEVLKKRNFKDYI